MLFWILDFGYFGFWIEGIASESTANASADQKAERRLNTNRRASEDHYFFCLCLAGASGWYWMPLAILSQRPTLCNPKSKISKIQNPT
jgi:hypothetical protein